MTKRQFFVAVLVPAFIAGCQAAPTTTAARTPTPGQTFQVWSQEPGSRLASSTNGVADTDIAELPDGRFRMYYLGPPQVSGQPVTLSAISSDGLQWTPEPGVRCQLTVCLGGQPGVVAVPSGGWRLFFNQVFAPGSAAGWGFTSAVTTDGLTFTADPGVRLLGSSYPLTSKMEITGAKVVAANEGGWRLYFSERFHGIPEPGPRPRIFSAHSADLINWTPDPGVRASAAIRPKVFGLHDGSYRLFAVCMAQPTGPGNCGSIMTATSADGLSWSDLESTGLIGGDPSGYVMRDGQIRLYYNDGDFYMTPTHSNDQVFSARMVDSKWGVHIDRQPAVPGGTMIERVRITLAVIGSGSPVTVGAVNSARNTPRQAEGLPSIGKPPFQATFEMQPPPQVQLDELIKVSDGNITRFFEVLGDPAFEVPNCGPGTSSPCPPINCGAGFGTPCSSMPCGSSDQLPCSVVRNAPLCQTGQPVGRYGCFVTNKSGFQEYCPPKANVNLGAVPNACAPYYQKSP